MIRITGVKAIDRALGQLERKDARKIVRQAMRFGFKATLAKARRLAPKGIDRKIRGKPHKAGTLRKLLKLRAGKGKRGQIVFRVATAAKDYTGEAFYASMVNWGTKKQRAQLYLNRALDSTKGTAIDRTRARTRELLNQRLRWWRRV